MSIRECTIRNRSIRTYIVRAGTKRQHEYPIQKINRLLSIRFVVQESKYIQRNANHIDRIEYIEHIRSVLFPPHPLRSTSHKHRFIPVSSLVPSPSSPPKQEKLDSSRSFVIGIFSCYLSYGMCTYVCMYICRFSTRFVRILIFVVFIPILFISCPSSTRRSLSIVCGGFNELCILSPTIRNQ